MVFPKSIECIEIISKVLNKIDSKFIFVGGATIPFYIPKVYWPDARSTEDVDVVFDVVSRINFYKLADKLRKFGFKEVIGDEEKVPLCKYVFNGLKVDVMSTDESVLGFTNAWYEEGVENCWQVEYPLPEVKILKAPYFLATKIEAFKGRGKNDFQYSHDMEDIISVLEVCDMELMSSHLKSCSENLKKYMLKEFRLLLGNKNFNYSIHGSIFNRQNPSEAGKLVINNMKSLIESCKG